MLEALGRIRGRKIGCNYGPYTYDRTYKTYARTFFTHVRTFIRTYVRTTPVHGTSIHPSIHPSTQTYLRTCKKYIFFRFSDFRTFGFLVFQTLLELTAPYCTLLDLTGPYWTLLDPTGPYWTLLQRIRIRTFVATVLSNVRRDGVI